MASIGKSWNGPNGKSVTWRLTASRKKVSWVMIGALERVPRDLPSAYRRARFLLTRAQVHRCPKCHGNPPARWNAGTDADPGLACARSEFTLVHLDGRIAQSVTATAEREGVSLDAKKHGCVEARDFENGGGSHWNCRPTGAGHGHDYCGGDSITGLVRGAADAVGCCELEHRAAGNLTGGGPSGRSRIRSGVGRRRRGGLVPGRGIRSGCGGIGSRYASSSGVGTRRCRQSRIRRSSLTSCRVGDWSSGCD
jgi:hypothetical protein